MQYADAIIHTQQVSTTLHSIEDRCLSALSHKLLSGSPMQYTVETASTITLNCGGLESINSHGICLLIKLLIYAKRQNKRLQVFGLSEHNKYIFEISRLNRFIDIVETENRTLEVLLS
jgi:anti-anti-sigma factor